MNNGAQLAYGQVLTKTQHVGHYEVGWNANILLLDISADTCLCGQDFVVLEETDHKVNVIGYNEDTRTKYITIGSAITLVTTSYGNELLLHVNEGLIFEWGKSLFSRT